MFKTFLFIFSAVVLAGGIQGYLAGSKASIIAGGAIAVCILAGALLLSSQPTAGLIVAGVGALALAGKFMPAFLKAPDKAAALWPAGVFSILSIVAIVWIVLILIRKA